MSKDAPAEWLSSRTTPRGVLAGLALAGNKEKSLVRNFVIGIRLAGVHSFCSRCDSLSRVCLAL